MTMMERRKEVGEEGNMGEGFYFMISVTQEIKFRQPEGWDKVPCQSRYHPESAYLCVAYTQVLFEDLE